MSVFDKLGRPFYTSRSEAVLRGYQGILSSKALYWSFLKGLDMFGRRMGLAVAGLLLLPAILAVGDSIPKDQVDASKIYYGSPSSFENAAEVDIETVVAATPEYQEIVKNKIDKGTGKYWILKSEASNRALKAVSEVADKTDYDLIAEKGYLKKLDPPIACKDITELVVSKL